MRGLGKRREAVRVVELGRVRPTARPPAATTPSPAVPPCAATWSTCPRASPPRPANLSCTCPPTGPGGPHGRPCGTTSSATQPRNPAPPDPTGPCPPRYPRPDPSNPQQGKAGAGQQITPAPGASTPDRVSPKTADDRSKSPIHGLRLLGPAIVPDRSCNRSKPRGATGLMPLPCRSDDNCLSLLAATAPPKTSPNQAS